MRQHGCRRGGTVYRAAGMPPAGLLAGALGSGLAPVSAPALPWEVIPSFWGWAILAGAAAMVAGLVRGGLPGGRRRPWVSLWLRLRWRMWPGPGFARRWTLWRRYGLPAARKVARRSRPSLSPWQRWFGRWQEYATFHGWAHGFPGTRGHRVYSTFEDITLTISPPQEGKSAAAAGRIIDTPGPVVVTSIRGDLITNTAGLRQQVGRLHVFNPEGAGEYGSTFAWNPVAGCQDAMTAIRRAGYMCEAVEAKGLSDADFWEDQASATLAAYLHAAGLVGGTMRDVYRWVVEHSEDPVDILARHPDAAENAVLQVDAFLSMPDRTRASVGVTVHRVLKFMQDPQIVSMLCPAAGEGFDFDAFLASKDTLYLVASDARTSPVPPLFTAFLAELAHHARTVGSRRPGLARLDPPLTLELDEVANIAPIPVAAWATWAAGSGIRMNLYAQAWHQLVARWGRDGAETLWQACKTKVIFTATSEDELAEKVSDLCGWVRLRGEPDVRYDRHGNAHRRRTYERVRVLPKEDVRNLPDGRAVVIRRNAKPTIVRAEQVWKRADVKDWGKSGEAIDLPRVPVRTPPAPDPSLRRPLPPPIPPVPPVEDEIAKRRAAKRNASDVPPLPPVPARRDQEDPGPAQSPPGKRPGWRPWHGQRPTGSDER